MLADRRPSRELPFLQTLLCLWATGWVTSAFTSLLFINGAYSTRSPALMVAVNLLLSSAVGAVVARQLLKEVVGCDLSYGAIVLALVAGSVLSSVGRLVLFAGLEHSGSPGLPVAGMGALLLPAILGALVSYWLLQNALRAETAPPADPLPIEPEAHVAFANPYAGRVAAARESTLGLVAAIDTAEPSSVPALIADGMIGLEIARKRLEETPLPDEVPAELPRRLALGMELLSNDLAETAAEAVLTTTGGARYRWELDRSEGLGEVREALAELRALGY